MEESYEEWNRAVIAWYEESEMVRKEAEARKHYIISTDRNKARR